MKEQQEKTKWFLGTVGIESEEIKNPFTGDKIELNPLEVAIYDFIIGSQMMAESVDYKYLKTGNIEDMNPNAQDLWENVRTGCSWFRENNSKAYMILLD